MDQHFLRRNITLQALCAVLVLEPAALWSAEAASPTTAGPLEEILVTARRRAEASIAVPMTLTRIDGATLGGLQYHDIDEFLGLSPGVLVYGGGDGVSSQITIRGVVTPGALVEPGNAVYVDEVYVSGMHTILPGFYDIHSVQVLKGPQAGLYGRNTTGGAVVITTGQPTDEQFARIDASYAQFDTREVSGTVNAPISASFLARGTGWYEDSNGGYYESNLVDENLDASHQAGGRLSLAFLPNDSAALTLTGEYVDIDEAGFPDFDGVVESAQLGPPPLPPESRRNVLRDDLGGTNQTSARLNGKLEFDTDAGEVVAVAGWRRVKVRQPGSDFDGTAYAASYADFLADSSRPFATPAPQIYTLDDRDSSLDAELRFLTADNGGPLKAVAGVSYFEENVHFHDRYLPVRDFALILAAIGQDGSFEHHTKQETKSRAGFAELIWAPVDTVELTTDLRYTSDRKDIDSTQSATGFYSVLPNITVDSAKTFDNWSPGITLAYRPDDDLTVFAKYVRGFRAGGFNTLVYNPALLPYDSEEAENYEVGGKTLLLDRRLEMGASAFYLRIDNALVVQADTGGGGTLYPLQNGGVAETTGLEFDLTARVATGLSLAASAGAYHYSLSSSGSLGLDRRPFAPDYTASLVADYQQPLTPAITGIAILGFRHRSGGILPAFRQVSLDSYNLLDAQVGVRFERTEIAAFVRNALNDHYAVGNYELSPGQYSYAPATGLDPDRARAIVRDPGSIFGVRLTVFL